MVCKVPSAGRMSTLFAVDSEYSVQGSFRAAACFCIVPFCTDRPLIALACKCMLYGGRWNKPSSQNPR